MTMTVKELSVGLALVGAIVTAVWAVQDRVATPADVEAAKNMLAGNISQEQNARIGSDYRLQYKYDKLDIDRRMQNAQRQLNEIAMRQAANIVWPTDAAYMQELRGNIADLKQQQRDLENWYRSIPK